MLHKPQFAHKRISPHTVIIFLLTLTLCFSIVSMMVLNRSNVEKLTMEQLILEKTIQLNDVLSDPQAFSGVELSELHAQGFAYEIWRINPDNNEKQIIFSSSPSHRKHTNHVEKHVSIMNADWYFRILSVRAWYEFPETWGAFLISICISLLAASITQNNYHLKILKNQLEVISNTDSLTGIHNRRYFMDHAAIQIEKSHKVNSESFIILFDLDHFKKINDAYMHQAGDAVLKEVATRITRILRPSDLFARYGGEEFIILASAVDQASAVSLAERIRLDISQKPIELNSLHISVTASFGISPAVSVNELKTAIFLADKALYKAKGEGRNKVVYAYSSM